MKLPDPTFPPILNTRGVRAPLVPFAEACRLASIGEMGAADVLWARRMDRAELAIVLEPEVTQTTARQIQPLAMVAAADCLGALTPPQVAATFCWPGTLLVNGGEIGSVGLAFADAAPDAVPDWLVLGVMIRVSHAADSGEPGEQPDITALTDEGVPHLTRTDVLQSYAAHFMTWLDIWQDDGFRPVHEAWMFRVERNDETMTLHDGQRQVHGRLLGLDEGAGAIVKPENGDAMTLDLLDALAAGADDAQ